MVFNKTDIKSQGRKLRRFVLENLANQQKGESQS